MKKLLISLLFLAGYAHAQTMQAPSPSAANMAQIFSATPQPLIVTTLNGAYGFLNSNSTGNNLGYGTSTWQINQNLFGSGYLNNPSQWGNVDISAAYNNGLNIDSNTGVSGAFIQKSSPQGFAYEGSSYTPSQTVGVTSTLWQYSVGDALPISGTANCYGGFSAGGDEGCETSDFAAYQGGQSPAEWTSTVATAGAAGATSVAFGTVTQGANTQGANRFLIDLTQAYSTGTVSAIGGGNTVPLNVAGSGTSWGVSTVNTTLGTAVQGQGTVTVTPGSMTGITTSSVLVVADSNYYETVVPSAVTSTTFTATFQYPHPTTAIVAAGGYSGYFFDFGADDASPSLFTELKNTLHYVLPIIRCTSATSCDIWTFAGDSSAWAGYDGQELNPSTLNTYAIYPGAVVSSVATDAQLQTAGIYAGSKTTYAAPYEALPTSLQLYPNTATFNANDAIALPLYPFISVGVGNWIVQGGYFPAAAGTGGGLHGITLTLQGRMASGSNSNAGAVNVHNDSPSGAYSGPYLVPDFADMYGSFNAAFRASGVLESGIVNPNPQSSLFTAFALDDTNSFQGQLTFDRSGTKDWVFQGNLSDYGSVGVGDIEQAGSQLFVYSNSPTQDSITILNNSLTGGGYYQLSTQVQGVPRFQAEAGRVFLNDGVDFLGFSDNQATQSFDLNTATGVFSIAKVTATTSVTTPQLFGTVDTLSGATPAINAAHRDFTITLSANATPTVSGLTAGEDVNAQVCQPATGGPYTWAWPAAFHGGVTIGTTAAACSMQTFHSFNGSTLVATSTGVINVAP